MGFARSLGIIGAGIVFLLAGTARADYYSHPEIRPQNRCVTADGTSFAAAGIDPIHCQKLIWDIPVSTVLGTIAVGRPYYEDSIPRFPNGITDRVPPMYVGTVNGKPEGFERQSDCTANATGCHRLCPEGELGRWAPYPTLKNHASGKDPTGKLHSVDNPAEIQSGPLFQLSCQRGSRSYFGPWQTGTDPKVFDRDFDSNRSLLFENTDRLDADQARGVAKRLEWNVGSEFYNHFASHHGTCYQPSSACGNPTTGEAKPRAAYQPGGECYAYRQSAEPDNCPANSYDTTKKNCQSTSGFRNGTQLPGRLAVPLPDNRGALGTEAQLWGCNHHVVTQLPPGSYGMTKLANYRLQRGGIKNTTGHAVYGVPSGQYIGGSVGEMVVQYFTEPYDADVKPVNVAFNAVADAVTTYYPPFTWSYHESEWFAPFDSLLGLTAIHSHHRMVKGTVNTFPPNPPRLNSPDPECGGWGSGTVPENLYTDWEWEDAPVCHYWREPDGPVPLRKGESMRTTCYVNNGVTPEAIKHGLVAGASVQAIKALGAPIPDYPAVGPAAAWGDTLKDSPVGKALLYGTHPPINYRVVYKCNTNATAAKVPFVTLAAVPTESGQYLNKICNPNPAIDADGDYIDGAYVNDVQCGGGLCQPASIIFACVGEDEMCIGVTMYWAMPRLGGDGSDEAVQNLQDAAAAAQAGNANAAQQELNQVGTPGSSPSGSDVLLGNCPECKAGL
jgi:hypothetical protein